MRFWLSLVAVLSFTSFSSPSYALFGDDEARKAILELRDQVQGQQEAQIGIYDRLDKLTREIQILRGELDELKNNFGKEKRKSEELLADLAERTAKSDADISKKVEDEDREILAKQDLETMIKAFRSQNYNSAIKQGLSIEKKYKNTKAYPDSQYWLASSYYAKGQFSKTITTAKKMATAYPKHAKASEALLIAGMAQLDSNQTANAKKTFQTIVKKYPKSSAAKLANQQLK